MKIVKVIVCNVKLFKIFSTSDVGFGQSPQIESAFTVTFRMKDFYKIQTLALQEVLHCRLWLPSKEHYSWHYLHWSSENK